MTFGEAVKAAIKTAGLKPTPLAKALGTSGANMSGIISGESKLLRNLDLIGRIEDAVGASRGDLLKHLPPGHPAHRYYAAEVAAAKLAPSLRVVSFTPAADIEDDPDLPFAGKVSCGPPGPGTACDGESMGVPREHCGTGRYILQAEGMSMIDFGITPGTFIVVMPCDEASNGQDVLAQVNGEFTLKRFVVRGRGEKRETLLIGSGDAKPIRIREGEDVRILGVVKYSFRPHK